MNLVLLRLLMLVSVLPHASELGVVAPTNVGVGVATC